MIEKAMAPSAVASSTPVIVTVCGVFQFAAVNVNVAGETVPSPVLLDDNGIVTSSVGCVSSLTWNVAVSADSLVNKPAVGVILMAGVGPGTNTNDTTASVLGMSS